MTRLIVWRHGQTAWNLQNRIQGQTDVALDDTGRAQAETAARLLAGERADVLVSSDLRRAQDTAATLAALTGLPVGQDKRLRERSYGEWEGLTHAEISARWPAEFQRWRLGEPIPECGLEDPDDVAARAGAALAEVAERVGDGTLVVVSHGGAARQGVGALLGWPPLAVRAIGPLGNCHWSELRGSATRGWRLQAHNVGPRAHAEPLPTADDAVSGSAGATGEGPGSVGGGAGSVGGTAGASVTS
ncbi:MAG: histidine phosphatase family protein [Micromonosporaceae bacterium]|nr:histidine phosphatase family protein [Micromonosporaceae bacterium]